MAQTHREWAIAMSPRFTAESLDFLKILRGRPRIREVEYVALMPHAGPVCAESAVNCERILTGRPEAVSELRRAALRSPGPPTRSAAGAGARIFHPTATGRPRRLRISKDTEEYHRRARISRAAAHRKFLRPDWESRDFVNILRGRTRARRRAYFAPPAPCRPRLRRIHTVPGGVPVNGALPSSGGRGAHSEVPRGISRFPGDHMRSAAVPGGRTLHPPTTSRPLFLRIPQDPAKSHQMADTHSAGALRKRL